MAELSQYSTSPRRILVALDGTDRSHFALSWALDTLITPPSPPYTPSDLVVLLHVQPHPEADFGTVGPGFYTTAQILDSVRKNHEEISKKVLNRAKVICDERLLATETMIAVGDPRDAICEAVEKLHADLLVVGTHGYSAWVRAFLGSVSDYCARNAKCPVVVVKKPTAILK